MGQHCSSVCDIAFALISFVAGLKHNHAWNTRLYAGVPILSGYTAASFAAARCSQVYAGLEALPGDWLVLFDAWHKDL